MARDWLIVLLLAVSLIVNGVTLSRIGQLREQVEMLTVRLSDVERLARENQDALGQVVADIARLEEEQRWLAAAEWHVDEQELAGACPEAVPVALRWTLRDLEPGMAVSLELRPEGAEAWQSYPAERTGELEYRAQAALDPRQSWEYRIVAEGASGVRATRPSPLEELNERIAKRVRVKKGDGLQVRDREWVRYVLQELGPGGASSACIRVVSAVLEFTLDGQVVGTAEMRRGRHWAQPPAEAGSLRDRMPVDGDDAALNDGAFWTDWIEVPHGGNEVRARITFGDGEEVLVPVPGYCCPPEGRY